MVLEDGRVDSDRKKAGRIMDPPRHQFQLLRQPLTPGEREVVDLLDAKLDPEWEIYIQPHLNGLRPDLVLLHPRIGIAVLEIKDWDLGAMSYFVRGEGLRAELWANDGQKSFSVEKGNPFTKVKRYRQEIFDLYCPRLPARSGFAAITAGVIFTRAPASHARSLQAAFLTDSERDHGEHYLPVAGMEAIRDGDVEAIVPDAFLKASRLMDGVKAADLRSWLVEPDFAAEQRRPLQMDQRQRQMVDVWPANGFRRVKGPAGSGKSVVLAGRAAKLASEGRKVLVVTFNITLWHYLRDMVLRGVSTRGAMGNIVFTNFHRWCARICEKGAQDEFHSIRCRLAELGEISKKRGMSAAERAERDGILEEEIPALAQRVARAGGGDRYDAILVDEGQDMRPSWWDALKDGRTQGGQMLLVADTTQDVYGKATAWTDDAMRGAGFVGEWSRLEISYRLPREGRVMADRFAIEHLDRDLLVLQTPENDALDLEPFHPNWVQCHQREAAKRCVTEILRMKKNTGIDRGLSMSDIVFICNDMVLGRLVSEDLKTYSGIKVVHTFAEDDEERKRQKHSFFMGRESLKATTLLSFKGWETRLLVVYISRDDGVHRQASVYAALTRIKRDPRGSWLTIVCSDPSLEEFGRPWAVS